MEEQSRGIEELLVSGGLWLAYILLITAIGIIAYYSLRFTFSNKQSNKKFLITAGLLLALFAISWLISPYEVTPEQRAHGMTSAKAAFIGGALIATYCLLGIALLTVIFFELKRIIQKD